MIWTIAEIAVVAMGLIYFVHFVIEDIQRSKRLKGAKKWLKQEEERLRNERKNQL